jgi:hypothetical protein
MTTFIRNSLEIFTTMMIPLSKETYHELNHQILLIIFITMFNTNKVFYEQ